MSRRNVGSKNWSRRRRSRRNTYVYKSSQCVTQMELVLIHFAVEQKGLKWQTRFLISRI